MSSLFRIRVRLLTCPAGRIRSTAADAAQPRRRRYAAWVSADAQTHRPARTVLHTTPSRRRFAARTIPVHTAAARRKNETFLLSATTRQADGFGPTVDRMACSPARHIPSPHSVELLMDSSVVGRGDAKAPVMWEVQTSPSAFDDQALSYERIIRIRAPAVAPKGNWVRATKPLPVRPDPDAAADMHQRLAAGVSDEPFGDFVPAFLPPPPPPPNQHYLRAGATRHPRESRLRRATAGTNCSGDTKPATARCALSGA